MGNQRLTTAIRESIRTALLRHRFEAERATLVAEGAALAAQIYDACWSRKDTQLMATIPEGWMPRVSEFRVEVAGAVANCDLSGDFRVRHSVFESIEDVYRSVPSCKKYGVLQVFDAGSRIAKAHEQHARKVTDFQERFAAAYTQVSGALASYSNTKLLVAGWPEAAPFVRPITPAIPLPAVPVKQLNKLLNLPVREAA